MNIVLSASWCLQVIEMIMVLIGKRMSFSKDQNKGGHSDDPSGRISASSSSTRFTKKSE